MAIANVLLGYGGAPKETVLTASDGSSNSRFGFAVSMSKDGNFLAVGAPQIFSVYIFTRSGSSWSQSAKLSSPTGTGQFGYSVSLSDDGSRLVVGDYWNELARVYTRSGSSWSLTGTATPIGGLGSLDFGMSVAISGDGSHFAVGATKVVHFFNLSGSTITGQARLDALGLTTETVGLGSSLALDSTGVVAVGGCPQADAFGTDSGQLIVFTRSGSTWAAARTLRYDPVTGTTPGLLLGTSVAINSSGTTVEGGAPGWMEGRGASFTFTLSNGSWSNGSAWWDYGAPSARGKSVALDSTGARTAASGNDAVIVAGGGLPNVRVSKPAGEGFGRQVSLSGDGKILAVGADNWNSNQGRVYVYG